MTGKNGFIAGLCSAVIVFLFRTGTFSVNLAPEESKALASSIIGLVAVLSTAFTFFQYYRKKAFISTTADGFVAGFASTIDMIVLFLYTTGQT